jgi:hypothetical protein
VASLAASPYCILPRRFAADMAIGAWLPLRKHRRPDAIAGIAKPPVFGRQLYELIGSSQIVLNGAIDMAGTDRGNMRCFEAMGCGALLASAAGGYPDGMQPGVTIETNDSPEQATEIISDCLQHSPESAEMAERGRSRVSQAYNMAS